VLAPLKLSASQVGDYSDKLLFPFAPSVGIGWHHGQWTIDAALYPRLIMSAQRKKPVIGLDITLSKSF